VPASQPALDIEAIGAAGGSIADIDPVAPRSRAGIPPQVHWPVSGSGAAPRAGVHASRCTHGAQVSARGRSAEPRTSSPAGHARTHRVLASAWTAGVGGEPAALRAAGGAAVSLTHAPWGLPAADPRSRSTESFARTEPSA